ncbi:type IV pilus modification PilV family protein [Anatilimnocola floriformis]|uniref:type IV pilus modification PilV family protein n=1 Tax=Anatilimnocola floriformis TaxID=2948575 RepID=UPI0020C5AA9E|nr:hypothetical protein [Anatilimnocola floriformis]
MTRQSTNRRGVSILEVLFAILITSIGLMGAIAVFPAALLQIKRGQQADATAAAGLSGIHMFYAMNMQQPGRWLLPSTTAPPSYWPTAGVTNPLPRMPARSIDGQWYIDGQFGYCIDPRFVAANSPPSIMSADSNANYFPYGQSTSPMLRVTLNNGALNSTTPMTPLHAESIFRIDDDLSYHRFTGRLNGIDVDRTNHSESIFVQGSSGNALKRESDGHLSWMATLTPKLERVAGASENLFNLSIVVFYDRPIQLQATGGYDASEWDLAVNMTSSMSGTYGGGISGGDMQLTNTATGLTTEEQARRLSLRRDQWIMLASFTLISGRRVPQCRWYRVIDADEPNGASVEVTLSGADWENTNQQVRAVVCQGVIAVFERTIKLDPRN